MSYAIEDDLETNTVNAERPEVSIGFARSLSFVKKGAAQKTDY
jgi:hypothetical protein